MAKMYYEKDCDLGKLDGKKISIIDITPSTLTLSVIGDETKTEAVENLLSDFGILELVRTGLVAIERGVNTINEDTKEKGEFNYGKNVL